MMIHTKSLMKKYDHGFVALIDLISVFYEFVSKYHLFLNCKIRHTNWS